jgi:hypothetical protein
MLFLISLPEEVPSCEAKVGFLKPACSLTLYPPANLFLYHMIETASITQIRIRTRQPTTIPTTPPVPGHMKLNGS